MDRYDIVIIGSGPGGYVAAIRAAQLDLKVVVVEKDALGGTCLNYGCIPTKAVLSSIQHDEQIDYTSVILKKDNVVEQLRQGIASLFKKNRIELLKGKARIISPDRIRIDNGVVQEIQAKNIIIATGSIAKSLDNLQFDGKSIFSSREILFRQESPKRLLIIGGGSEGCEFATMFSLFGSVVTLIEGKDRLLPNEDNEISKRLENCFKRTGINVLTSTSIEDLKSVKADCILVCIGRIPHIDGLGLNEIGVGLENGRIKVNDYLKTDISNIYAIGDVIGSGLAHVASYEGIVAVENITGKHRKRDYRVIPNCIFTYPEVASVGFSEERARQEGRIYKVVKFPFSALGISHCYGKTEGFVKLLGDAHTGELLGGCIIGYQAVTLIHTLVLAMKLNASMRDIADTIAAHPTFPEALREVAASFYGEAIHSVI